jgi:hypothetical protein
VFKRDPRQPIVVVNERTHRRALWAVTVLFETGDPTGDDRARIVAHLRQIAAWLRHQIQNPRWWVCPTVCAERLEQVEELLARLTATGATPV